MAVWIHTSVARAVSVNCPRAKNTIQNAHENPRKVDWEALYGTLRSRVRYPTVKDPSITSIYS